MRPTPAKYKVSCFEFTEVVFVYNRLHHIYNAEQRNSVDQFYFSFKSSRVVQRRDSDKNETTHEYNSLIKGSKFLLKAFDVSSDTII